MGGNGCATGGGTVWMRTWLAAEQLPAADTSFTVMRSPSDGFGSSVTVNPTVPTTGVTGTTQSSSIVKSVWKVVGGDAPPLPGGKTTLYWNPCTLFCDIALRPSFRSTPASRP